MKLVVNQRGYALIIVLLIITLFLGASATFLAGLLNHATQERTIDTSNQAVASAEMGVFYFNEDFQRYLEILKENIAIETQAELDKIVVCDSCNRFQEKQDLDIRMREKYIDEIILRVEQIDDDNTLYSKNISNDGYMKYLVDSAISSQHTNKINITLNLIGKAKQGEADSERELTVEYSIDIPTTFLITTQTSAYEDVYREDPGQSCTDMIDQVVQDIAGDPLYECNLDDNLHLSQLIKLISDNNLNPKDFRAFTNDFLNDICGTEKNLNCNTKDFSGVNVTIHNDLTAIKNMNELKNFTLYLEGRLDAHNLNELTNTVLVVKELDDGNVIEGMKDSTIAVLGYEQDLPLAHFKILQRIRTKSNSFVCMNIDRIIEEDLKNLSKQIILDATSKLYYYTTTDKSFSLTHNESVGVVEKRTDYAQFLKDCGISVWGFHTEPYITDSELNFSVIY